MSISSLLARSAQDTVVYWGAPTWDEYGGKIYPAPVEKKVLWEDATEIQITSTGEEVTYSSVAYVLEDLEPDGYLYLGNLAELTASEKANPETIAGAKRIKSISTVHSLNDSSEVVRKVFL